MADLFYMSLERDEELVKGERKRLVRGIASTESEDRHGEEMVLSGMDFDPYLEHGRLNWDHMKGPSYILGKPLEAKIVTSVSGLEFRKMAKAINGPAFFHLCELYDSDPGHHAWQLLKAEENDPDRAHGFSVEGAILLTRGKKLSKTRVDDCALTPKPANTDTFAELVKSLSKALTFDGASDSLGGIQYIDDNQDHGSRINQAVEGFRNIENILWGPCEGGCLNKHLQFVRGAQGAYLHLVKCRGIPEDDAYRFVKNLAKSGIF